jgi:hypothetical protein
LPTVTVVGVNRRTGYYWVLAENWTPAVPEGIGAWFISDSAVFTADDRRFGLALRTLSGSPGETLEVELSELAWLEEEGSQMLLVSIAADKNGAML